MHLPPWHGEGSSVYHDNAQCTTGNNIEPRNRLSGTGSKRLCKECERLHEESPVRRFAETLEEIRKLQD